MPYPFIENAEFWSSLEDLDQRPETAHVVNALVGFVVRDPLAWTELEDGIRIAKSPRHVQAGREHPALRLAFRLVEVETASSDDPWRQYVELLKVETYDEEEEAAAGLSEAIGPWN